MPEYGILVYSPAPADPMSITPEYLQELESYGAKVEQLGGKITTGYAFSASTEGRAIRGTEVSDGTVTGGDLVAAGYFVLEAPDLDTAVAIAKLNPAAKDGGVEVRPMFEPPAQ